MICMSDETVPFVSNLEMATVMVCLPAHLPLSDEYEQQDRQDDAWWESQREHWISWFYSRACKGGFPGYVAKEGWLDAGKTYGGLQCPAALIWLAEAFGVDEKTVSEARDAGLKALAQKARTATRCKAIRDVIPWATIAPLARNLVDSKNIKVEPSRHILEQS